MKAYVSTLANCIVFISRLDVTSIPWLIMNLMAERFLTRWRFGLAYWRPYGPGE